jgi:hypothetical protein
MDLAHEGADLRLEPGTLVIRCRGLPPGCVIAPTTAFARRGIGDAACQDRRALGIGGGNAAERAPRDEVLDCILGVEDATAPARLREGWPDADFSPPLQRSVGDPQNLGRLGLGVENHKLVRTVIVAIARRAWQYSEPTSVSTVVEVERTESSNQLIFLGS